VRRYSLALELIANCKRRPAGDGISGCTLEHEKFRLLRRGHTYKFVDVVAVLSAGIKSVAKLFEVLDARREAGNGGK
jgi:hypothetical protein